MGAGLVLCSAAAPDNLLLRNKIGTANVMPPINRRVESVLERRADVHQTRAAWTEKPFMRISGEQIHRFGRHRESAHGLNGIQAEENPAALKRFGNVLVVDPITTH